MNLKAFCAGIVVFAVIVFVAGRVAFRPVHPICAHCGNGEGNMALPTSHNDPWQRWWCPRCQQNWDQGFQKIPVMDVLRHYVGG